MRHAHLRAKSVPMQMVDRHAQLALSKLAERRDFRL